MKIYNMHFKNVWRRAVCGDASTSSQPSRKATAGRPAGSSFEWYKEVEGFTPEVTRRIEPYDGRLFPSILRQAQDRRFDFSLKGRRTFTAEFIEGSGRTELDIFAPKHVNNIHASAPGFTLIELLFSVLIASLLSVVLFSALFQVNRSSGSIDSLIDIQSTLAIAAQQLERDITGAFIPTQPSQDEKKQTETTKIATLQSPTIKPTEPKKEQKKITHIFYGMVRDGQLDTLTLITNNPLQMYWSDRAGKAKPRIARVVYRLIPEKIKPHEKPSYTLEWQEDSSLDFDAYKADASPKIRAYQLLTNIKSLTIKYGAFIEKKQEEKSAVGPQTQDNKVVTKKEKKPEYTYQQFDDWNLEKEQKEEEKDKKQKRRLVPHDVTITITVWDAQKIKSTTMPVAITIIPELAQDKKENKQPLPQPSQPTTPVMPPIKGGPPIMSFIPTSRMPKGNA